MSTLESTHQLAHSPGLCVHIANGMKCVVGPSPRPASDLTVEHASFAVCVEREVPPSSVTNANVRHVSLGKRSDASSNQC